MSGGVSGVGVAAPFQAAQRRWPQPSAVLALFKPVTWFPPMWAFACGVTASGASWATHWATILLGVLLAGPLVCATSQAVNDWFDREVDAINEPHRPIPSGRIPGRWGLFLAIGWTGLSLGVAWVLGPWVLAAATLGLALAWAYSAPPLRLKMNGWWGNAACGISYEGLAWVTGAALLVVGPPDARSVMLAALYSAGAHGIMTLNDFKAIEGDSRMGVRSLPVQLGVPRAAQWAVAAMLLPQAGVVIMVWAWGFAGHAGVVLAVLVGQALLARRFLSDPVRWAVWFSGFGVALYVSGMMASALAVRSLLAAGA